MFSPVQIIFYVNCYFLVYACTFELFDRKPRETTTSTWGAPTSSACRAC